MTLNNCERVNHDDDEGVMHVCDAHYNATYIMTQLSRFPWFCLPLWKKYEPSGSHKGWRKRIYQHFPIITLILAISKSHKFSVW